MGLLSNLSSSVTGAAGVVGIRPTKEDRAPEGADANDTEELDEEPRSILMGIISQLRIGMDLQKVTLPTFVLEPRSMLERITDFMSHPDLIFGAGKQEKPEERFIEVLSYYLSGWHIKPKGVKKPYNPVLGEFFRCSYHYPNGTKGYYIAEQVSHHPPVSAYYYISSENDLLIYGELKPKSKFLGNSAATLMEGENRVVLLDRKEDGEYRISMPNMYARGILFGRMVLELGDMSTVRNDQTDIQCDVEFKTKGFFTGTYNALAGRVKQRGEPIADISGIWSDSMDLKNLKSGETKTLFNAKKAKIVQKSVRPEEEQGKFESRRLWTKVTDAIKASDMEAATAAKTEIEDAQRDAAREREEKGEKFEPRFFVLKGDTYYPRIDALDEEYRPQKAIDYFSSSP